jgi:uncharacterized membrane protein
MNYLKVILISAVPVIEQRGAIPLGILLYDMNPVLTCALSFLGSLLPVPFVLLLFNIVFDWMKKIKFFNLFSRYIQKKLDKGSKKVEHFKYWGLLIFVAIPLPTTGLWTGSAIASFLGLDFKKSFLYIAGGGIISAVAITILTGVFPAFLGY